jgi:rod shape-determining protein MreC
MQRRPPGSISRVAVPVKALLNRFSFLVLLAFAATLMIVGRIEPEAVSGLRGVVVDAAAPVLDALSRPVESANRVVAEVEGLLALREENAELLRAVERLRRWELAARQLEHENAALRDLLSLRLESRPAFISARVIGDSGSAFVRTLLVNAGAGDGVERGQAAITGAGLVGRVVEVGRRASRILLVTDLNSRVPVLVEATRQRAVLAGDNSATASLQFMPRDAEIKVGARIVTSGHGGVLPPGLPAGVVSAVVDGVVRVQPLVDLGRVEYVRLLAWQGPRFEPVLPPAAGEAETAPDTAAVADTGR